MQRNVNGLNVNRSDMVKKNTNKIWMESIFCPIQLCKVIYLLLMM